MYIVIPLFHFLFIRNTVYCFDSVPGISGPDTKISVIVGDGSHLQCFVVDMA